jgi:hypothetical protein
MINGLGNAVQGRIKSLLAKILPACAFLGEAFEPSVLAIRRVLCSKIWLGILSIHFTCSRVKTPM